MVLPLSHIKQGERARIVWIASKPDFKQRLMILGFRPKETLSCMIQPSRGSMGAYFIHNTAIAIRQENANEIFVEILKTGRN